MRSARPAHLPPRPARPAGSPADPVVLGIETSTAFGSVAVVRGETLLGARGSMAAESHSERILPGVRDLLADLGLGPRDLAAVAVSRGPGSFTGLRIGLASAQGVAFALGIPLYGLPTLELLAANCPPGDRPVCAMIDARRREVFLGVFQVGEAGPSPLRESAAVPLDGLAALLPEGALLVGQVPPILAGSARERCWAFAPAHLCLPCAGHLARLGASLLRRGAPSGIDTISPLYLRLPDAEVTKPVFSTPTAC